MIIVIDSGIPYIKGVLEPFFEVRYRDVISAEDVRNADAIVVRTRTMCNEKLLGGGSVRMVATATAGTDHIDMDFCARAGIAVADAAGSNARAVLQWVAAALAWRGRRGVLGVVGVGNVGRLVVEYAKEWGFEVVCCDPPKKIGVGLKEIAEVANIVTFHVPLTEQTRYMADADFFDKLGNNALILNSSRGEVVDAEALMKNGNPCCIDVWDGEPLVDRRFLEYASLATPHIAGYSIQGKANATAAVVRAISREFGLPLGGWYPSSVVPVKPRKISWEEMCATIGNYFDIESQTRALKENPSEFESFRNNYQYRQEFF